MDYNTFTTTNPNYTPFIWLYHKKEEPPKKPEPSLPKTNPEYSPFKKKRDALPNIINPEPRIKPKKN